MYILGYIVVVYCISLRRGVSVNEYYYYYDCKVLCCLAGLRFTYCMPNDVQLSKLIEGSLYHGASS
jgi:hypothetical protein